MRSFRELLPRWRDTLASRGRSTDLVWLPGDAMVLRQRKLYIRPTRAAAERDVESALRLLDPADAGVFLLVAERGRSYCTLLLDPFGSDDDTFLEDANFHFCADPYANDMELVESTPRWFRLRLVSRVVPRLSSLDYAFTLKSARTA